MESITFYIYIYITIIISIHLFIRFPLLILQNAKMSS